MIIYLIKRLTDELESIRVQTESYSRVTYSTQQHGAGQVPAQECHAGVRTQDLVITHKVKL